MVVCYSHCLLPLCQLSLTSPLARGDILLCSATGCLCDDFLFWFACRFQPSSVSCADTFPRSSGEGLITFNFNRLFVRRFFVSFVCRWAGDQWSPLRCTNKLPLSFYNKISLLPKRQKGSFTFPKGIFHICESKYFIPQGFHLRFAQISLKKHPERGAFSSGCFFIIIFLQRFLKEDWSRSR